MNAQKFVFDEIFQKFSAENIFPTLYFRACAHPRSNTPGMNVYFYMGHSHLRTEDLMLSGRLFVKMKNRTGLRTDPWGTPDSSGTGSEALPSKTTC